MTKYICSKALNVKVRKAAQQVVGKLSLRDIKIVECWVLRRKTRALYGLHRKLYNGTHLLNLNKIIADEQTIILYYRVALLIKIVHK